MLISTIIKHFHFQHFSLYEWPLVWIDSLIHKFMNEQEFTMNKIIYKQTTTQKMKLPHVSMFQCTGLWMSGHPAEWVGGRGGTVAGGGAPAAVNVSADLYVAPGPCVERNPLNTVWVTFSPHLQHSPDTGARLGLTALPITQKPALRSLKWQ